MEPGNTALYLRVRRSDGGFLTTVTYPQIDLDGAIYVSSIDPKGLQQLLAMNTRLTAGQDTPTGAPRLPMRLLYPNCEEDPFGFFVQVWLGGVVQVDEGTKLLVKHPTNLLQNRDYEVLDGIVESDRWMGLFAVALRPRVYNRWISVDTDTPLCQVLPYQFQDCQVETVAGKDVPRNVYMDTVRWHCYDPEYGAKLGKYQRQLTTPGPWDCTWERQTQASLAESNAASSAATQESTRETDKSTVERSSRLRLYGGRYLRLISSAEDKDRIVELRHGSARYPVENLPQAFIQELVRHARFTAIDAMDWGGPETGQSWEDVRLLLRRLLDAGILRRADE